MFEKPKKPELMTSAELEQAIKDHQEYVRKLIAEVRARRKQESSAMPPQPQEPIGKP